MVTLQKIYKELDFEKSIGFYRPVPESVKDNIAISDWLKSINRTATNKINIDAVFFIKNLPVVLYFRLDNTVDEDSIRILHKNVWNLNQPAIMVIEIGGEIRIYDIYKTPFKNIEEWNTSKPLIKKFQNIDQILVELEYFNRQGLESGTYFQKSKDHDLKNRVDRKLLHNLREVRKCIEYEFRIIKVKEKIAYNLTQTLIIRSIFIRFLEDRKIISSDYFQKISDNKANCYVDILLDQNLTYQRLFTRLEKDFNGDIFKIDDAESVYVTQQILNLLSSFLKGESQDPQIELFFWAYDFKFIPIELISSIYEDFYHSGENNDKGTHYTPTVLVDFILDECLTPKRIESKPKILDCSCGSGVFLVRSFRRIARYLQIKNRGKLKIEDLKDILKNYISGIDNNENAIRIASFSLYLALLDFMEPPDIDRLKDDPNDSLPTLIYSPTQIENKNNIPILYHSDAFETDRRKLPLEEKSFDLVVGNPPWVQKKNGKFLLWNKKSRFPVSKNQMAQMFVWRALSFLKEDGEAGLLLLYSVLHSKLGKEFRKKLLNDSDILKVYHFAHVRNIFFSKSIAPFIALFFKPSSHNIEKNNKIKYISIKHNKLIEKLHAIVYSANDLKEIKQYEFMNNDDLWKILWWGNRRDAELIDYLKLNNSLGDFLSNFKNKYIGNGYFKGKADKILPEGLKEIKTESLNSYTRIRECDLIESPEKAERTRDPEIYNGYRLLIKTGITKSEAYSRYTGIERRKIERRKIVARLTNQSFFFRDSILCIKAKEMKKEEYKIILGIILSSVADYYYFMTSEKYGFWRERLTIPNILSIPIKIPTNTDLCRNIINAVEILSELDPLFFPNDFSINERYLDNLIFELFELNEEQRDLILDMVNTEMDFLYKKYNSISVESPTNNDIENYISAFCNIWNPRLIKYDLGLNISYINPENNPLIGMIFKLSKLPINDKPEIIKDTEIAKTLRSLHNRLPREITPRIYLDRQIKYISGDEFIIIKRSEKRLWTKTQARIDADQFLAELLIKGYEEV